jgi:DNA-binding transcriptional regulator/RsmH inhibitor MraZ
MELHLDLDNLEKLFTQLNGIPDLKLDDKSVRNFILTLSELEVDKSGRFRLPAADRNSSAFVDMSVVMSDVDVPDIEVSGTPELVARIGQLAKAITEEQQKELLAQILSTPRPTPLDPKQREAMEKATMQAARPVLEDLAKAGYPVTWIINLSQYGKYQKAIPILLQWLPKTQDVNVKAAIAGALQVRWLPKSAASVILDEYLKTENENERVKFTLGTCLGYLANPEIIDDLLAIAVDKRNGTSRKPLVAGLGKVKQKR